jgi:hypothetical protein
MLQLHRFGTCLALNPGSKTAENRRREAIMKRFCSISAPWFFVAILLIGASVFPASASETISAKPTLRDGFRGIPWGASEAEAKAIHPDLAFVRFVLPEGEAFPSRLLVREKEKPELFGIPFDQVNYWFRNDRFWKATAEARGGIGPRTIESQSDLGFEQLATELKTRYGAPSEDRFSGASRITRTMTWAADGKRVSIIKRTQDGNLESLIVEISD